jgi:hypothetical protein
MPHHTLAMVVGISLLLASAAACKKQQTPPPSSESPENFTMPAAPNTQDTTKTILEKTFDVKRSATFSFEVPAHTVQPHLHGIFQSFAGEAHGLSDDTANIEFLILNEQQQADLAANRPSDALFSVEASHNQSVNFDLPATMNDPVKYYLVFRNAQGSKQNKVVEANFRVEF